MTWRAGPTHLPHGPLPRVYVSPCLRTAWTSGPPTREPPPASRDDDGPVAIDSSHTYPAAPDAVLALLTDEAFLRERATALGAQAQEVTVDGRSTSVRFAAPTAGIPPVFARFVGSSVSVVERTSWTPDGDGYRTALDIRAEVFGRTVEVTGERRLTAAGAGTTSTVTGDARVDAPLIGRQAEGAVRELVGVVLKREDELLRRKLS
nr:DUF2505 domain-containing protein [Modestobacter versicolor]